ncbi:hypothetical protein BT69DRAFT_1267201 [Atractiella rhizophila]|nr:hypothetical protein BT69DRAFT_1267201 [Atractiella rhizophila]
MDTLAGRMSSLRRNKSVGGKSVGRKSSGMPPLPFDALRPPHEVLHSRYQEYKHVVKSLIAYFENLGDYYVKSSKDLTKISGDIQAPLHESSLFIPTAASSNGTTTTTPTTPSFATGGGIEKGLGSLLFEMRDRTRSVAAHHVTLAKSIESNVVEPLRKMRIDIKGHISSLEKEVGKRAEVAVKERDASHAALVDLSEGIGTFGSAPMALEAHRDPYVANVQAAKQLKKQLIAENDLQTNTVLWQQKSEDFEKVMFTQMQTNWRQWEDIRSRVEMQIQQEWATLAASVASVPPDVEWKYFGSLPHLQDPTAPLRDVNAIKYPGQDHEAAIPVKTGVLDRKKRFTKMYSKTFNVLTPAGYLHEYKSVDADKPALSLFLPFCTLGFAPDIAAKEHKWHIEGNKAISGTMERRIKGTLKLGNRELAYTFRAKSHEEAKSWWEAIEKYTKVSLALQQNQNVGPVPTAVQGVGLEDETEDVMDNAATSEEEETFQDAATGLEKRAVPAPPSPRPVPAPPSTVGRSTSRSHSRRVSIDEKASVIPDMQPEDQKVISE